MPFDLPDDDTIEVSLIGTGGGYGESIVIHLGNQKWVVVDSCQDPKTKVCLPLEYLQRIGVDIANNVQMLVCTHWDDDHIRGISELLETAKSGRFCMAKVNDQKKFLQFVGLDSLKIKGTASSTTEFGKCLELLGNRDHGPIGAVQDRTLLSLDLGTTVLWSLSPSDFVVDEFDHEISGLIRDFGVPNRKYFTKSPNEKSVVLLLTVHGRSILLGADLEVSSDRRCGWLAILETSQVAKGKKASLFKIPHHGSENGYLPELWNDLLTMNPIAKLTPWNRNKKLPKEDMVKTYSALTSNLYITSSTHQSVSPKKRDNRIAQTIREFNPSLREIKYEYGVIRSRIHRDQAEDAWKVDLFGSAKQL
jgi:beta-lactamase superfamily II metal-dependent hydrolase